MEKKAADARSQRRAATARLIEVAGGEQKTADASPDTPPKDYRDTRPKQDMRRRSYAKVLMAQ